MKGLFVKDFKLMKTQKNFFLIIIVSSIFMAFTSDDNSVTVGVLGFIGSLFTLTTISYDEHNNGNAFLFCLPVTRKSYVLEKYCFGLFLGGASWLFGTIISLIAYSANNAASQTDLLQIALLTLPVILLLLAIMLPFQFQFGGEKARIAIIVVVGLLAALGSAIIEIANVFHVDLIARFYNLPTPGMGMLIAAAAAGSALLMLASLTISIGIMNRKEF